MISKDYRSEDLLTFYMGKNTPKRQEFIIENLRVEKNLEEEFLELMSEELDPQMDGPGEMQSDQGHEEGTRIAGLRDVRRLFLGLCFVCNP